MTSENPSSSGCHKPAHMTLWTKSWRQHAGNGCKNNKMNTIRLIFYVKYYLNFTFVQRISDWVSYELNYIKRIFSFSHRYDERV